MISERGINAHNTYYWVDPGYSFTEGYQDRLVHYIDNCTMAIIPSGRYYGLKKSQCCWNGYAFALWFENHNDAVIFNDAFPSVIGIHAVHGSVITEGKIQKLNSVLRKFHVHTS